MSDVPLVSVVIVNYNAAEFLPACLTSLAENGRDTPLEVIVIDNNSTDGSAALIRADFPWVKLVETGANLGFAGGNNRGIEMARGDLVLILNPDTVLEPGTITALVGALGEHPRAGIVGPMLLNDDGSLQPSVRSVPSLWNAFCESTFLYQLFPGTRLFGRYYMSYFRHDRDEDVDVVMGACMLARRETLAATGGFDERFFMYSEETDLCYRARRAGWRTLFTPRARVVHFGGGSSQKNKTAMFVEVHRSQCKWIRKYHGAAYSLAFRFVLFLGVSLRVGLRAALRLARPRRECEKLRLYRELLRWYLKEGLAHGGSR